MTESDGGNGGIILRKMAECKNYFQDLFMDCLREDAFERSIFDSPEKAMFEMHCNTLKFIYGDEFERVKPVWSQEALNEFYSEMDKAEDENDGRV